MSDISKRDLAGYEPYPHDTHTIPTEAPQASQKTIDLEAAEKLKKEYLENKKVSSPATEAMRFSEDKMRFDLLPIEALVELTRVYQMGALKYDDDNWRKGMSWRKVYRPIFSHLFKWLSGEAVDKETGCHHLAMVAWNALTLVVYEIRKLGKDDRIKFNIDENFNWTDNHLGLGLSPEKMEQLKLKYKQQRESHK